MSVRTTPEDTFIPRELDAENRVLTRFEVIDPETGELIKELSRTKQEFRQDADINRIVAKVMKTGSTDWLEKHQEWLKQTGEMVVSDMDYKEIMDEITGAESKFMELPSAVRSAFDNDPANFLDFVKEEGGDVTVEELIAKTGPAATRNSSVMAAAEATGPENPVTPTSDGD